MSAAVLSRHVVSVPPRQTCHLRASHPTKGATSIRLTDADVQWDVDDQDTRSDPLAALHLATDPDHKLPHGEWGKHGERIGPHKIAFAILPTKTVYVEIGNCSDTPLLVDFEIRGEP